MESESSHPQPAFEHGTILHDLSYYCALRTLKFHKGIHFATFRTFWQFACTTFSAILLCAIKGIMSLRWAKATEGLRWRVFDAKGEVLGRLASRIAVVLMGKDKPTYTPHRDDGDVCIVLNAKSIGLTGNKLTDKVYRWHTGYIGHLKERTVKEQMARKPEEVIRKAVLRMLPRNKLQDDRARKLRIFPDDVHPFADKPLEPYVMPPRKVREFRPRERRLMLRSQQNSSKT